MAPAGEKLKYQKVKDELLVSIQEGQNGWDECLPSEHELCRQFDVSRVTIRKAVEELEKEGLLYRLPGKGTFVKRQQKITQTLSRLTSFTEDMQARHMKADSKILLSERIAANKDIAERLDLNPGDEVIMFRRLRLADDAPMAIETIYLDYNVFFPMLTEFSGGSFYTFMRERLNIVPKRALQSLEVAPLMQWEAELLGNVELSVALLMNRQTFDESNRPIEYVVSKYRSDKYKFTIELYNP